MPGENLVTVKGTSSTATLSMKKASGGLTKEVLIKKDVLSDMGKFRVNNLQTSFLV